MPNELQNQGIQILKFSFYESKFYRNIILLKLALKGSKTIFICGYSLNSCVYENNIGVNELRKFGFQIILIRDLTIVIEHLNLKQELAYHSTLAFLEADRISTITSFQLLDSHKEFNLKAK